MSDYFTRKKKLDMKFKLNNNKLDAILNFYLRQKKYKCLFDDYTSENPDEVIKYMEKNYYDKLINYSNNIWILPEEISDIIGIKTGTYQQINDIIKSFQENKGNKENTKLDKMLKIAINTQTGSIPSISGNIEERQENKTKELFLRNSNFIDKKIKKDIEMIEETTIQKINSNPNYLETVSIIDNPDRSNIQSSEDERLLPEDPRDEGPRDEGPRDEGPRDEDTSDERLLPEDSRDEDSRNRYLRDEGVRDEDPRDRYPRDEGPRDEDPRDEDPRDEDVRDENPRDRYLDTRNEEEKYYFSKFGYTANEPPFMITSDDISNGREVQIIKNKLGISDYNFRLNQLQIKNLKSNKLWVKVKNDNFKEQINSITGEESDINEKFKKCCKRPFVNLYADTIIEEGVNLIYYDKSIKPEGNEPRPVERRSETEPRPVERRPEPRPVERRPEPRPVERRSETEPRTVERRSETEPRPVERRPESREFERRPEKRTLKLPPKSISKTEQNSPLIEPEEIDYSSDVLGYIFAFWTKRGNYKPFFIKKEFFDNFSSHKHLQEYIKKLLVNKSCEPNFRGTGCNLDVKYSGIGSNDIEIPSGKVDLRKEDYVFDLVHEVGWSSNEFISVKKEYKKIKKENDKLDYLHKTWNIFENEIKDKKDKSYGEYMNILESNKLRDKYLFDNNVNLICDGESYISGGGNDNKLNNK